MKRGIENRIAPAMRLHTPIMPRDAGAFAVSINRYEDLLARFPTEPDAYFGLAEAYRQLGDLHEAQFAISQAIQLNDAPPLGILDACRIFLAEELGDYDAAIAGYRNVLAIAPDNRTAQQRLDRLKNSP